MEKIEIGSVVKLKSGGPNMTVIKIPETVTATCLYYNDGKFELIEALPKKALIFVSA